MMDLADLKRIVCRPATARDTDQVIELVGHIWEGEDYVPHVWEAWLGDTEGLLAVAEFGGRIAGLCKITRFGPHEWWLEGLRVHPQFQEQKVASHMHEYCVAYWERVGSGVLRLATASFNVKVHHLCDRTGFNRIVEFIPFKAAILGEPVNSFQPLLPEQVSQACDYAVQSYASSLSAGLINLGWRWADVQDIHLTKAIQREHAWWWRDRTGLLTLIEDPELPEPTPVIQLISCPMEFLKEMLLDYRRLAASMGYAWAGWIAPLHPALHEPIRLAGFLRDWDESVYVFERRK